jgi:integrase
MSFLLFIMGRRPKNYDGDLVWNEYKRYLMREGISQKRIETLRARYMMVIRELRKPINDCDKSDLLHFVDRLSNNEIKTLLGHKYKGETKSAIKSFLKQYYKWLRGGGEFYPPEVAWIKTNISKDERSEEKPVLSINQVVKLANCFNKEEYRVITLLLFDSGFRIDEMESVTKKDLTWEEYRQTTKGTESCFWIKCNRSKTEIRQIPVPLFTPQIQDYLNSTIVRTAEDNSPLFPAYHYTGYMQRLKEYSRKLYNVKVSPHALRHSSATYYSELLNSQSLAMRYGWKFNSKQLNNYLRRSKNLHKIGAEAVYNNNAAKLQEENEHLKDRLAMLEKSTQTKIDELETRFLKTLAKLSKDEAKRKLTPELVKKFVEIDSEKSLKKAQTL